MSDLTDDQDQPESTPEKTKKNLGKDKKENQASKSNSELMTEFFSINSDMDKNENFEEKRWHWT